MAKRKRRFLKFFFLLLLLGGAAVAGLFYFALYTNNINQKVGDGYHLYVKEGDAYSDVFQKLTDNQVLLRPSLFDRIAKLKKYDKLVKPGHYLIKQGLSNASLVNKLRAGAQDPVKLLIKSHYSVRHIIAELAPQLLMDQEALAAAIENEVILTQTGLTRETLLTLFIPNTYEVYWTISPEELILRLKQEYDAFWNPKRKARAEEIGLRPKEVVTLASIVQAETYIPDELKTVAGLYMNRIRRGMKLEADPTLIFALQDFSIERVLNKHKEVNSPYNTYKYKGLPPGPIRNPEIAAIDAVLNHERHEYIFMVAQCDRKRGVLGRHNFSTTNRQHERYAAEYRSCYASFH